MTPEDKRAIAESKKAAHKNVYVVAIKIGARYSLILRMTKKDAMNTYNAARGYRAAVAYRGDLIANATHDRSVWGIGR